MAVRLPQELQEQDPARFGVSICTVDGQQFSFGDAQLDMPIMNLCKPFLYALALKDAGEVEVHKRVGTEPTSADPSGYNLLSGSGSHGGDDEKPAHPVAPRPHNPFMDSGALTVCSVLANNSFSDKGERYTHIMRFMSELAGGRKIGFHNSVFLALKQKALKTLSISFFIKGMGCYPDGADPTDNAQLLFQAQSIEMSCESLAVAGATLAHLGHCPTTGAKILEQPHIRSTLLQLHSSGLNRFTGRWAFSIGVPACSSGSGMLLAIVPNVMAVAIYSPLLNDQSVPVRAFGFCEAISRLFRLNIFEHVVYRNDDVKLVMTQPCELSIQRAQVTAPPLPPPSVVAESEAGGGDGPLTHELFYAAALGNAARVQELIAAGADVNKKNFDHRTPLHVACAEGHTEVAKLLLTRGADPAPRDRWGSTPRDEAVRGGFYAIAQLLDVLVPQHMLLSDASAAGSPARSV